MNNKNKANINYVYFGILFFFIFLSSSINVLSIENIKTGYRIYFIFHCLAQAFLEALIFVILASIVERYLNKICFYIFLTFSFVFFLIHIIDFILIKLMDLSFFEALGLVLGESISNFIEMLVLTGIPIYLWIFFFSLVLSIPIFAILAYKLTANLSKRRPLYVKKELLFQTSFCVILALFLWDFSTAPTLRTEIYGTYQKSLPWKTTFLANKKKVIKVNHQFSEFSFSKRLYDSIESTPSLSTRPNIYIFVIESLREDYITDQIAPNFYQFKKEGINTELSLANSNNTHSSWFSIFYSKYPFHWTNVPKKNWTKGSIPLNILKKAGYKINVFSSSGLRYYCMDSILFGKGKDLLADDFFVSNNIPAYFSDELVIKKALKKENSSNVNIIFLESTHFHYSLPPDYKLKFHPSLKSISSIVTNPSSHKLNCLKNRYKNSIHYLDTLFASFIASLKEKNIYDDSIIIVTADHGEEFFEKGHLFHASHLSKVQTHIPIFYKLGPNNKAIPDKNLEISSQIDIFPTILDYLFPNNNYFHLFDGESLFKDNKKPFVLSTRYKGSKTPHEFFYHNTMFKITMKFASANIFNTKKLNVLSIRNLDDNIVTLTPSEEKKAFLEVKANLNSEFNKDASSFPKEKNFLSLYHRFIKSKR